MIYEDTENSAVNELSLKFLSGNITEEEISDLACLLKESRENRKIFKSLRDAWYLTSSYQIYGEKETDKAWIALKQKIHPSKRSLKFFQRAAVWTILIASGAMAAVVFDNSQKQKETIHICQINIPLGSKSHMILPDSSEVWLNAGSVLRFPEMFSTNQRDVYLSGEGYFKVKSNKKRPFIVHTSDVTVKAFGTIFNVKAYPSDKTITTTLVEGVVKLENETKNVSSEFTYTLKPKENLVYFKSAGKQKTVVHPILKNATETVITEKTADQNTIIVNENINPVLTTSWKDPRWVIEAERLDNLAVLLGRKYALKINVLSPELSRYKFSGIIENETIEQVLKYLKLSAPVRYVIRKGEVDLMINESLRANYTTYLKNN